MHHANKVIFEVIITKIAIKANSDWTNCNVVQKSENDINKERL